MDYNFAAAELVFDNKDFLRLMQTSDQIQIKKTNKKCCQETVSRAYQKSLNIILKCLKFSDDNCDFASDDDSRFLMAYKGFAKEDKMLRKRYY